MLYLTFLVTLKMQTEYKFKDQMIPKLLDLNLKIFAVDMLMQDSTVLYETGYFTSGTKDMIEAGFQELLKE